MVSPNLFHFAPSELSQDAFLCWLFCWAKDGMDDINPALHATAHDLIEALTQLHGVSHDASVPVTGVLPQEKNADIVVLVGDDLVLLIEDKVDGKAHSGQLERYYNALSDTYPDRQLLPTYFKTGDQSHYKKARRSGYEAFQRGDFLTVLQAGLDRGAESDIFTNYHAHLQRIDEAARSFEHVTLGEWPHRAWNGFYTLLQQELGAGHWDYVSNPRGGFVGFWWKFTDVEGGEVYLQIEEERFCFKVKVYNDSNRKAMRSEWHRRILNTAERFDLPAQKPSHFGHGEHMSVAVVPGDFRISGDDDVLDIDATIDRLQQAEEIFEHAVESI